MERSKNKGTKNDEDKAMWFLLYFPFIEEIVRVLMLGYKKYGYKNYMNGLEKERIQSAMFRHAVAYMNGEYWDEESGQSHLAHVATNAMMLVEIENEADS